jgi:hypothetical protein
VSELPPAGWHPDPEDPTQQRYWDGSAWTEHRAPAPAAQPGYPPQAGYPSYSTPPQQTSGAAVVALVLGVLSIITCLGPFTGVPALIVGRRATRDIDESDGRVEGRGMAQAGLLIGFSTS